MVGQVRFSHADVADVSTGHRNIRQAVEAQQYRRISMFGQKDCAMLLPGWSVRFASARVAVAGRKAGGDSIG